MVNFDLILEMIQQIDSGDIPSNITFGVIINCWTQMFRLV